MKDIDIKNIIECEYCGLFIKLYETKKEYKYKCPRCKMKISQYKKHNFNALYYSISAFLVFILLNIYPLISLSINERDLQATLIDTVIVLFQQNFYFVSLIVFFTIILSPLVSLVIIIYSFLHNHTKFKIFPNRYVYNLFQFFKSWGFIDVFILSIIVTYIKLIGMVSTARFDIGFYLILFYIFLFFMANKNFEIKTVFKD
ncbi:paraquat-inducible protein A [Halarcobacter sp.]|uniref:paraquat-inducible protein A n=1 Tax=Halarcobacter sp. TaxID=2321133 RepID=UPI0029F50FAE|nr:paraquat-inducible protein A [Halarcobacter sp.]